MEGDETVENLSRAEQAIVDILTQYYLEKLEYKSGTVPKLLRSNKLHPKLPAQEVVRCQEVAY